MTIVLRHNHEYEISRVDYSGAMIGDDLEAHASFNSENPALLGFDCLSVIHADIDVGALSFTDLDQVFRGYHHVLFRPRNFLIKRRSGWLCEAPDAAPLLQHWLNLRDTSNEEWNDVRLFTSYSDVAKWLVLNPAAREALNTLQGFAEIARFGSDHPACAVAG